MTNVEETLEEGGDPRSLETRTVVAGTGLGTAVGWAIIVLAILAVLAALAVARVFVVPVIMAFLLALVFSPLCRWFRRRGVPEPVAALAIVLGLLAGLAATSFSLALPVSGWLEDAPGIAREAERKLRVLAGYAEAVSEAGRQIEEAAASGEGTEAAPVEVVIAEQGPLTTVALGAPLIVAQTVFVLILTFFILASGSLFYERLVRVMPTLTEKKRALQIAYDIERDVSRYLLSITVINAGLGLAVGLAMALLGMPSPLAFGLLAFALNFVPFLGAIGGVAISFAVALVTLPTAFDAFVVAAVYFALTSVEGQVVTPWLVGRRLRLNTVVILIAVAFWAWLWSVMGMIMAVPLLVCLRVLCQHVEPLRPFGEFLAGREDR
ncbi:AI-2E family transporter [Jannaschia aquimarina]|uniref:Pheromone autoinducer 2 transporter n=1 Tax=Jannaschia aquimarina TaxID=935700 RepID=A0A0D1EJA4_9RHOB|nr:AI-2E family transporter [Jannaschia aquimarina]KIT17061.1 pheromone autoinducer 2 transporter [Jannaschia aquimarina]SNS82548.1 Predicted PurR-regulated permease PerM [Jannaschia aquimarina]